MQDIMFKAEAGGGVKSTAHVFYSNSEIAGCKEAWQEFQWHPIGDWEFFRFINERRTEVVGPCVIELNQGGETRSLLVGRLQNARVPFRLGYLRFGSIGVRSLNIVKGGLMGDNSEDACKILLQTAMQTMADKKLDLVDLGYVPCEHPLFRLARDLPRWYCRDLGATPGLHWSMNLPKSFDEFLGQRSKKHRYWLKRLPKVLEETYPGQVAIRNFKTPDDVDEFARDAAAVSTKTYQHRLGEGFNGEYKERCDLFAAKGGFCGYILYIKGEPKAYWLATVYRKMVHLNLTGYEPQLRKFELGTILLMRLFADHCGTSVEKVDFGFGGAGYKERFGDECFQEASIRIYSARVKPLAVNVLAGFNGRFSAGIKAGLAKLGLLQKLKTRWRTRLSGRNDP